MDAEERAQVVRRRIVAIAVCALALIGGGIARLAGDGSDARPAGQPVVAAEGSALAKATATTAPVTTTTRSTKPSADRRMEQFRTIRGRITPKSVVASGHGLVFAQNMMYSHTITAYDAAGKLLRTIPDTVDLAKFGVAGKAHATYRGAPVEAAFTADGRHAYVSNYSMYGPGFGPEGKDGCKPGDGTDDSFVYRVNTKTLAIDQVIQVGPVPKYVALTPDGRYGLVSNWCSSDMSVVDLAKGREVRRVPIGRYPRGIAIDRGSKVAYVAVMGGTDIVRVDLDTWKTSKFLNVGRGPRHLVLSPADRWLYVTTNKDGHVSKLDARTGADVGRASTGTFPRSLAMAADGGSLYVVNYGSDTVSKVRTDTMAVIQTLPTGHHPIGVAYEPTTGRVWVANYSGSIVVFDDT